MQYAKGIQTKEHIFQNVKHLMYQYGFKKTTYSMIAEVSNVPIGLVNYYFKKRDLLLRIYEEFLFSINTCIAEQTKGLLENELQRHILMSEIMLTQIFSDPQTLKFHLEINRDNLVPIEIHDSVRKRQIAVMQYFHVPITPQYYYWCATAEYGARRELIEQNKDIDIKSSHFERLLDLLSTATVRMAGLSPEIINENLVKSHTLLEQMMFDDIKLLM